MFERILVPTDGSQLAAQALPVALALGAPVHARIHLLRSTIGMWLPVLPTTALAGGYIGAYDWLPGPDVMDEIAAEARASLQRLADSHPGDDVTWQQTVSDADPATAILDYCHEQEIDLVVMSSHGHSGLERWALGSVTERVLRHAPCPVLVVREGQAPALRPPQRVRRILIPLDGSRQAEAVLAPALQAARLLDSDVTLLRVEHGALPPGLADVQRQHAAHALGPEQNARAADYLQAVKERSATGLRISTAVVDGRPAPAILDYAAHHEIDLIAMATHGLSGLRRWLYGSVTEKVLRASHCSLLIVRPPWEDESILDDDLSML